MQFGTDHILALTNTGLVYAWGLNGSGQLGINNTKASSYAKLVLNEDGTSYLSNIVDISAGSLGSSAIDKNGNVYVWGNGTNGEIGNDENQTKYLPTKANVQKAIKISMGHGQIAVLTTEGALKAWGLNAHGQNGINCSNLVNTTWTNAYNTSYPMKTRS